MPIQPGLALQVKGLELPDPLAMQAQATQIQNALQQQRMGEMQIQNAMREQRREQDYETVLSGFKPGMSLKERVAALQQRGLGAKGAQYAETQLKLDKANREAEAARIKAQTDRIGLMGQLLSSVSDQSTLDAVRPQIARIPGVTEDDLRMLQTYGDGSTIKRLANASMTAYQRGSLANAQMTAEAGQERARAATSQAATAAAKLPFERQRADAATRQAEASVRQAETAATRASQEKLTPAEREYQNAKARGEFTGNFVDWKRMVQPRMFESSGDVGRTNLLTDRVKKVDAAGESATKLLPSIDVSMSILDQGFQTGWGTPAKKEAARILAAFGSDKASNYATSASLFLSESRKVLLERMLAQKGTQSENDAKRIEESFVALGNTPEANRFMLSFAKAQAKNEIAKQNFYEQWYKANKTYEGAEVAWNESEGSKSIFDTPEMKPYRIREPKAGSQSATPRGKASITSGGNVIDYGSLP